MTQQLFDISRRKLAKFRRGEKTGQPSFRRKLNDHIAQTNRNTRNLMPVRQVTPDPRPQRQAVGGTPSTSTFMRIVGVRAGGDLLNCVSSDIAGNPLGGETLVVAMPWMLRRTPFDPVKGGGGRAHVNYAYTSDTQRTATRGVDSQQEVRVPSYWVGDVIRAIGIKSTTMLTNNEPVEVSWFDTNDSGRAWAKVNSDG